MKGIELASLSENGLIFRIILFVKTTFRYLLLCFFAIIVSLDCFAQRTIIYDEDVDVKTSLVIHEGIVSEHKQTIIYRRNSKRVAKIKLSEPVVVAVADKEYPWGYFQFPSIGKTADGTLIARWSMKEDSHRSYGKKSDRGGNIRMSKDKGLSWTEPDKVDFVPNLRYGVVLDNGNYLGIRTPVPKNLNIYERFPKPISMVDNYSFYYMDSIPEDLQGIYFTYRNHQTKSEKIIHAKLNDPGALRYSIDDLMPVVWWGNIIQLKDGSLMAGTYPNYYLDTEGEVCPSPVSFFHSVDSGYTWNILGKIPYPDDVTRAKERRSILTEGFTEPAFAIIDDGTFLCVMRTGATSPMYISFSKDHGQTWSIAKPFTSNGVMPSLLKLNNGVLVLASGRPGVQLRFSFDGAGEEWTEPIDMLPYMEDYKRTKDNGAATCGYASLLKADDDSFYMVYSDFKAKNELEEERKAILFRKITIRKR